MDSRELRFANHGSFPGSENPDLVQNNGNVLPSPNGKSTANGEVDHIQLLSSQLKSLLRSEDFTDVTFIVEGEKIFCS